MGSLKTHLRSKHGIEFEDVQKVFPSVQLFEEWKSALENERFFNLIAVQGEQVNGRGERRRILMCNRSGTCLPKGASQRSYPQKGQTCKIGRRCTCQIQVRKFSSGEVKIDGCLSHYGHSLEVPHSRVPKLEREKLAGGKT